MDTVVISNILLICVTIASTLHFLHWSYAVYLINY